jgi:hypothetical protein
MSGGTGEEPYKKMVELPDAPGAHKQFTAPTR